MLAKRDGKWTQDNFNRKKSEQNEGKKEEKFISLSAAFDHYESRQMEILMGAHYTT